MIILPSIPPREFIHDAGACLVTTTILTGAGFLTWAIREKPANSQDSGWRFFADTDTDQTLADPDNIAVVDFNRVAEIEPAIIAIYAQPVGSDLRLTVTNGQSLFYDNITGNPLDLT
ncbi:DUF2185 domain-containing protein [Cellulomonas hominis]